MTEDKNAFPLVMYLRKKSEFAQMRAGVKLHALRVSKTGESCHPLYLPYDLQPVPCDTKKPWEK